MKKSTQYLLVSLIFAIALLLSARMLSDFKILFKRGENQLYVEGVAEMPVPAVRGVFRYSVRCEEQSYAAGYQRLQRGLDESRAILAAKNFPADSITIEPVQVETVWKKNDKGNETNEVSSYLFIGNATVHSGDLELMQQHFTSVQQLFAEGFVVEVTPPEFFAVDQEPLRPELLAQATRDAMNKAELMASRSDSRLGGVLRAEDSGMEIVSSSGKPFEKLVRMRVKLQVALKK